MQLFVFGLEKINQFIIINTFLARAIGLNECFFARAGELHIMLGYPKTREREPSAMCWGARKAMPIDCFSSWKVAIL